jgi:sulfur carrier protein
MSEAIILNGKPVPLEHTNLDRLVAARVAETRRVAVAVNGLVVPRGAWPETRVRPGDTVEIIKITVGG